ncbi:hypothetical protein L9F63_013946 [Diploptera punctata]|uniref:Chromatin assembly factor 1 subunit A dimerization domain-containing protein n=1 Tax=Diploptera punctata TaxID=6984 RepID=A0AAD8A9T3_DIPPU|nr:hypothetical protein L9F63_013946 [Diploptera punctata]
MPFEVKADMRLAPNSRNCLSSELKHFLDEELVTQSNKKLYLYQLRRKEITPRCAASTWTFSDFRDDDVVILGDEMNLTTNSVIETYPTAGQLPKPKLLQFWENRRPPYWGTWRKKSCKITPVKPFNKDEKEERYEVDSDDEWEEEEPGESLHGSEDEKESEDEYEVDNEFFVPHGYLSEEEHEEEENEVQSPERMKAKLKLLELEFEEEMKQKTDRLKPRLIGCRWKDDAPDPVSSNASPESNLSTPSTPAAKRKTFPTEGIPALIRLIHGNINRREFLVKEFIAYWNKQQKLQEKNVVEESVEGTPSSSPGVIVKRSVSNKIKELATWVACPEEGPMLGRLCWYVPHETREAYGFTDLSSSNSTWVYTIKPKRRESNIQSTTCSPAPSGESTPKQLITKFTKPMTDEERKKQLIGNEVKSGNNSSHSQKITKKLVFNSVHKANHNLNNSGEKRKKVSILLSGPRGQELPKSTTLMKFIKPQNSAVTKETSVPKADNNESKNDVKLTSADDDCIVLE